MARPQPERGGLGRLVAAWRNLAHEQRLVVVAAVVLLASMLLPWYSLDAFASVRGVLAKTTSAKPAITVFSFVEAAIFLVAVGVTLLVLARGDRRAFHLPGGDGTIVTAAGAWATFLIFYRFVDKPGADQGGPVRLEYGLSWGIFFGLIAALALVAAGLRLRAAHVVEPALPGDVAPSDGPVPAATRAPAATGRAARGDREPARSEELTREQRRREREARRRTTADTPVRTRRPAHGEAPTTPPAPDEAPTTASAGTPEPPFGAPPAFEPPEFEPPPRPRPGDR